MENLKLMRSFLTMPDAVSSFAMTPESPECPELHLKLTSILHQRRILGRQAN